MTASATTDASAASKSPGSTEVDVLVIGAGQAGLAAGFYLARSNLRYLIVDRAVRVGESWRGRYDSLTLFTPRQFSALPGLALDGDPNGYPARDEFAAYLESYARAFQLSIELGSGVARLAREADGRFHANLENGRSIVAQAVIIAAGAFQQPVVPHLAQEFDSDVVHLTPDTYRNPGSVPAGVALVVGDGASGRDVATELAATHRVFLAKGKPRKLFPERILGRSTWWWLRRLGLMQVRSESFIGRLMRRADPFPNRGRSDAVLKKLGIGFVSRLTGARGKTASFADGERRAIDAVIWCVGYRDNSQWLDILAAKDAEGNFLQENGRTPVVGLFHLGRPWQRSRSSALVMGVGDDAAEIVDLARRMTQ